MLFNVAVPCFYGVELSVSWKKGHHIVESRVIRGEHHITLPIIINSTMGISISAILTANRRGRQGYKFDDRGEGIVGMEGIPLGVLSPLALPRDVESCPSPGCPHAAAAK
jgi:hypothetical protein